MGYTTTPTTTTPYVPTICPYGTPIKVVFEKVFANNDHSSKPVVVEISSNGKEGLPKNMELFKAEDEDSMYLEPHQIERKYSNALNTFLSKLLPRTRSQTAYAVIFKTKKSESDIKYMFTQRHIVGRVWRIVFPEQDSYIYNNDDGTRNVVTVLRRVQNGRRYLGIDFWYSHYYLGGYYGIPDFYKLVKFPGLTEVHEEKNRPAVMVTDRSKDTYYIECRVETTPSTTPTTYTTTHTHTHRHTTTPTTTTPTTTTTYTTTPPTTTTYTTITRPPTTETP